MKEAYTNVNWNLSSKLGGKLANEELKSGFMANLIVGFLISVSEFMNNSNKIGPF